MGKQDFSNLDPLLRNFGEYIVNSMEVGLGKRLDKMEESITSINQRLDRIENLIGEIQKEHEITVQIRDRLVGKWIVMDAISATQTLVLSKDQQEKLLTVWENLDFPKRTRRSFPPEVQKEIEESYNGYKDFLSSQLVS